MKKTNSKLIVLILLLALIGGYWVYKQYLATPDIDFKNVLVTKNGVEKPTYLNDLLGKVTLIAFFQTWCVDCIKEMPSIKSLQNQVGSVDFKVLIITDESTLKLEQFKKRFPEFDFDYYTTNQKLPSYGIKKYPTTYLLNSEGKVLKSTLEGYDWSESNMVVLIKEKLSENY